ncbi:MAG: hypothetical protein E7200_00485 [Selenomonas ruminantium]|nr:hypothetical protein [Selenomonas ruminantium]
MKKENVSGGIGAVAGKSIGGIGIAARGGAVGIPAAVLATAALAPAIAPIIIAGGVVGAVGRWLGRD